jgi:acetylornithine deacetylase
MHSSSHIIDPMVQKPILTVELGPLCGDLTQNAGVDEWFDVENSVHSIKVAVVILVDWSGQVAPVKGKAI